MLSLRHRLLGRTASLRVVCLALLGLALAGCDKCGNRIKLNAPMLPTVCGDNADPAR